MFHNYKDDDDNDDSYNYYYLPGGSPLSLKYIMSSL